MILMNVAVSTCVPESPLPPSPHANFLPHACAQARHQAQVPASPRRCSSPGCGHWLRTSRLRRWCCAWTARVATRWPQTSCGGRWSSWVSVWVGVSGGGEAATLRVFQRLHVARARPNGTACCAEHIYSFGACGCHCQVHCLANLRHESASRLLAPDCSGGTSMCVDLNGCRREEARHCIHGRCGGKRGLLHIHGGMRCACIGGVSQILE